MHNAYMTDAFPFSVNNLPLIIKISFEYCIGCFAVKLQCALQTHSDIKVL